MRFYYLDFSRAVLFSLGLVIHAALVLRGQGAVFSLVYRFIHSFRMESFFLIAGFFSGMMLTKRGAGAFLRERLLRLGVPLVFCGLTFNTMLAWVLQEHGQGFAFVASPRYWLEGHWLEHLWFLATLIVYVGLAAAAGKLCPAIDQTIRNARPKLVWVIPCVSVARLVSVQFNVHCLSGIPSDRIWFEEAVIEYWAFYLTGYLFYHHQELLEELIQWNRVTAVGVGLFWALTLAKSKILGAPLVVEALRGAYSLGVCALLFAVARRVCNREHPIVRAFSDASYTIYLVHWPFMAILSRALRPCHLSAGLTFVALIGLTGILSYAFHTFLVRRSRVLSLLLNGRWTSGNAGRPLPKSPGPMTAEVCWFKATPGRASPGGVPTIVPRRNGEP